MRKHPILFSALMIRAILAGRKTQTRRTLTELAETIRDAYRPGEAISITLQPGDHEAIAKLVDLVEWAKQDPNARAAFNGWRAKRRGRDG